MPSTWGPCEHGLIIVLKFYSERKKDIVRMIEIKFNHYMLYKLLKLKYKLCEFFLKNNYVTL